jgi:hypothetical protein
MRILALNRLCGKFLLKRLEKMEKTRKKEENSIYRSFHGQKEQNSLKRSKKNLVTVIIM